MFFAKIAEKLSRKGKDPKEEKRNRVPIISDMMCLRDEIAKTLETVRFFETWDKETFILFGLDLMFLEEIRVILNRLIEHSVVPDDDTRLKVANIFKDRWRDFYNTPFCRTLNPHSMINNHYRSLATIMFDDDANKKLMPTLPDEDIYGTELKHILDGEIVLVSDGKKGNQFIHIPSVLDTAIARYAEAEEECLLIFDQTLGKTRPVSAEEAQKMIIVHPMLKEFFDTVRNSARTTCYSIRDQLLMLRNGLKKGDVAHKGNEYVAGSPAFDAVRMFHEFFDRLPDWQKEQLRDLKGPGIYDETLGTIYDNLTNPKFIKKKLLGANGKPLLDKNGREQEVWEEDVTTCVQIRGDYVDNILNNPINNEILAVSVDVDTAMSKLKEFKAQFDLQLESHKKAEQDNQQIVDENHIVHDGKLLRRNWERYLDKFLSMQDYASDQDEVPFLVMRKFIDLMQQYFPNRISQRHKWANVFIALNRVALLLPTVVEKYRMHYVKACFKRIRLLAHDFRFFDKGAELLNELEHSYSVYLEGPIKFKFKPPKDLNKQLQSQHIIPRSIEKKKEKRVRVSIANVELKPDQAIYISLNGQNKLEKLGTLKCFPMKFVQATNEWVFWEVRKLYSDSKRNYKYWIGPASLANNGVATSSDMTAFLEGVHKKSCYQDLKELRGIAYKDLKRSTAQSKVTAEPVLGR